MTQAVLDVSKMAHSSLSFAGQMKMFDITFPASRFENHHEILTLMGEWWSKFAFQLERGDGGYEHYQVRLSLMKKVTCSHLLTQIIPIIGGHWTVTSRATHDNPNSFNYCMKAYSRVSGPWTDKDVVVEPPQMTRQLATFLSFEMRPYQKKVMDMAYELDDRSIKVIYDPTGDAGKSVFSEYLEYKGLAFELPPLKTIDDIMQFCFSFPPQRAYVIDMPRSMKKDKLGEFYAGVECLKNGVVYDTRYTGKKRRFDRPQVIIFTNKLPTFGLLSKGRWEVWEMTDAFDLVRYDPRAIS